MPANVLQSSRVTTLEGGHSARHPGRREGESRRLLWANGIPRAPERPPLDLQASHQLNWFPGAKVVCGAGELLEVLAVVRPFVLPVKQWELGLHAESGAMTPSTIQSRLASSGSLYLVSFGNELQGSCIRTTCTPLPALAVSFARSRSTTSTSRPPHTKQSPCPRAPQAC